MKKRNIKVGGDYYLKELNGGGGRVQATVLAIDGERVKVSVCAGLSHYEYWIDRNHIDY